MAAQPEALAALRVALLGRDDALRAQLKQALTDLGAHLVHEGELEGVDPRSVSDAAPAVVLVNLQPGCEDALDALDPLMEDPAINVVFNEAESTSQLTGWDLARWARHLAAKVLGHGDTVPPPPPGAEVLPARDLMPVPGAPQKPQQVAPEATLEAHAREALALRDAVPANLDLPPVRVDRTELPEGDVEQFQSAVAESGFDIDLAAIAGAMSTDLPTDLPTSRTEVPSSANAEPAAPAGLPRRLGPDEPTTLLSVAELELAAEGVSDLQIAEEGDLLAVELPTELPRRLGPDEPTMIVTAPQPAVPPEPRRLGPHDATTVLKVVDLVSAMQAGAHADDALDAASADRVELADTDATGGLGLDFDAGDGADIESISLGGDDTGLESISLGGGDDTGLESISLGGGDDTGLESISPGGDDDTGLESISLGDDDTGLESISLGGDARGESLALGDAAFESIELGGIEAIELGDVAGAVGTGHDDGIEAIELGGDDGLDALEHEFASAGASKPAPASLDLDGDFDIQSVSVAATASTREDDLALLDAELANFGNSSFGALAADDQELDLAADDDVAALSAQLDALTTHAPEAEVAGLDFSLDVDAPRAPSPAPAAASARAAAPAPAAAPARPSFGELSLAPMTDEATPMPAKPARQAEEAPKPAFELGKSNFTLAPTEEEQAAAAAAGLIPRVIVLGASIGGPDALRTFLAGIPADFPALFVLAQHLDSGFFARLAQQLQKTCKLPVRVADDGQGPARCGQVIVVPANERFSIGHDGTITQKAHREPPRYKPCIDEIMRDVADRFAPNVTAIIFSGMAGDAIEGAVYLTAKGGEVWAQAPESCVVSSMVDGATARGVVEFTGTPRELADHCVTRYSAH